jgi:predicted SprT family Zn-dependent metalloprotease
MSEIQNNNVQYFCEVCGKNPNDTPKILKRYKPDIYIFIYYCGNCGNYFMVNRNNELAKLNEWFVKTFLNIERK